MDRNVLHRPFDSNSRMFAMARQGTRVPHIILSTIMLLVLTTASFIVVVIAARLLFGVELFSDVGQATPLHQVVLEYTVPFALMIVFLWVWMAFYEKRPFRTVGFAGGKALKKYFVGFAVGFVMVACAVGLMAATGSVQVETGGSLPKGIPAGGAVLLLLLAFVVQAAGEETLLRGWYLQVVGARHGPWIGVVASSLVFAAFHGFTTALATVNLALFAVFLALYCLYEGSIWGVCGWHTAWNWTQGNVFGLDVTGYPPDGGVLVDLQARGSQFLSGGSYGPEGSLLGSCALLTGIVVLIVLASRKLRKPTLNRPVV